jgi:hypothetical protein
MVLLGPVLEVAEIASALGAWEIDDMPGFYSIGCDYSLPDFIPYLAGYSYPISAGNYLFRYENTNTCLLGIRGMDIEVPFNTDKFLWSFGDVFLRSYYTTYDLTSSSSPRIGVAKSV